MNKIGLYFFQKFFIKKIIRGRKIKFAVFSQLQILPRVSVIPSAFTYKICINDIYIRNFFSKKITNAKSVCNRKNNSIFMRNPLNKIKSGNNIRRSDAKYNYISLCFIFFFGFDIYFIFFITFYFRF